MSVAGLVLGSLISPLSASPLLAVLNCNTPFTIQSAEHAPGTKYVMDLGMEASSHPMLYKASGLQDPDQKFKTTWRKPISWFSPYIDSLEPLTMYR
ncbi:hypothetical protein XELAEV_18022783mg [Xenopus laevis]|uniref:Uncharacterized protein n=1 Tax=Xenopus laevis TaxID=8355 RepID=A0A974D5P0_XENLA|nr:hypothetical protein XELAEV_18022783mg [Xenopus laevis]